MLQNVMDFCFFIFNFNALGNKKSCVGTKLVYKRHFLSNLFHSSKVLRFKMTKNVFITLMSFYATFLKMNPTNCFF